MIITYETPEAATKAQEARSVVLVRLRDRGLQKPRVERFKVYTRVQGGVSSP